MEFVFPSTEATAESPELFRACEFIEDAIDKITTLRQQLAESQARCAELEDACIQIIQVAPASGPLWFGSPHVEKVKQALGKAPTRSFILRAQADAVEAAIEWIHQQYPHLDGPHLGILTTRVQRLRKQAEEAERGGM